MFERVALDLTFLFLLFQSQDFKSFNFPTYKFKPR